MHVLCCSLPPQLRSHVDILKKAVKDEQAQRTSLEVCTVAKLGTNLHSTNTTPATSVLQDRQTG